MSQLDKILENNNSKDDVLFLSQWAKTKLRCEE